ncbi:uncharacterized protein B0I36DRAFT_338442 [Microdochium trichocladiopsis]|uniref:CipC-like antibiotic response protein n=1 Tax=Microdochium trichocladiopsis TaxID=1682393 RepID=A0A9P8XRT3_9PEZI|nr:uncharacterized protein B0I36DRAFT_338442 [Microdochium trichocladiopsis]KAH7014228.1 hypothetical protein B0I36DRAFT_338442 [Microdochium trichocladiopsis]
MFGFDEGRDQRDAVYNGEHEGSWGHELVAGGAAFEAMHLWENHQRAEGQPVSHGFAKEMIAGFAGAEVDKLFETKGLDYIDREKAKHEAKRRAENLYDQQYGNQDQWTPDSEPHEYHRGQPQPW